MDSAGILLRYILLYPRGKRLLSISGRFICMVFSCMIDEV